MPVPHIFAEGQPVDADKVNADFADVLTKIAEAVAGSSETLDTKINGVKTTAESALSKANSSVQINGNQTINGTKTFSNPVYVAASTKNGTALQLADQDLGGQGYIKLGSGVMIQWYRYATSSEGQSRSISLLKPYKANNTYSIAAVNARSSKGNDCFKGDRDTTNLFILVGQY